MFIKYLLYATHTGRRKRGERFGRLGSCTESVQANKVQACNGKDSEHLPKHGEEAT